MAEQTTIKRRQYLVWRLIQPRKYGLLLRAGMLLGGLVSGLGAAPNWLDPDELAKPGTDLFTNGPVISISIQFTKDGLNALRRDPRMNVPAVVMEGGKTYKDVAVHLKGAVGSFRGVDDKPGMMLNFDKMTPGQKFHGLKKIMLNNSVQDPAYLNEKICGYLFRMSGVPSPRTGHAMVELNGRKLGLYVLKEDFNQDFFERYFKNANGNLYDINPGRDISDDLRLDFGDGPKDRADLKAAAEACSEKSPDQCWEKLRKTVDVERFISLLMLETLTSHWDGYSNARNNFKVFSDLGTGRLVFLPNDLDQMFGDPGRNIYAPGGAGLVAQAVMRAPEGRRRYFERVDYISTNVFQLAVLTNRVQAVAACVGPALAAWNKDAARDFTNHTRNVMQRLISRAESLEKQRTEFAARRAKFDQGAFKVAKWAPMYEGGADLQQKKDQDRQLLYIRAGHGGAPAWRGRTVLGTGKYRFEGNVKTTGVVAVKSLRGEGAGLGVSGKPVRQNKLAGDSPWQKQTYEFDVTTDGEEVELFCELRASKGEVWFDAASLQLVKVK